MQQQLRLEPMLVSQEMVLLVVWILSELDQVHLI